MNDDWLETDDRKLVVAALYDDTTPMNRMPMVAESVDPQYRELILALRGCLPVQRTYIRAMLQTGGNKEKARRMLEDRLITVARGTVFAWHRRPAFNRALDLAKKFVLRMNDIDPISLQLKAAEIIEDAMKPTVYVNKHGDEVHGAMEHNAAMRGIEWLGKVNRMTEDEKARVTFEIVTLTGVEEPIDVTPEPADAEIVDEK